MCEYVGLTPMERSISPPEHARMPKASCERSSGTLDMKNGHEKWLRDRK